MPQSGKNFECVTINVGKKCMYVPYLFDSKLHSKFSTCFCEKIKNNVKNFLDIRYLQNKNKIK